MIEDIKELFFSEDYQGVIKTYNQYKENNSLDYNCLYYALLSCIGLDDIYLGLSIIKNCSLLHDEETNSLIEADGANFINMLKCNEDMQKALVICLYLENNKNNSSILKNIEANINYFELIGSLYELGYNNNVIKELTNIGHMIYKI